MGRVTRSDAYPEDTEYHDQGCSHADSCLSCPFAVCRYDVHGGVRMLIAEQRSHQIIALRAQGKTVIEVADMLSISIRTVRRLEQRDQT